jgi:ABC-type antimicrobial peptide transport system permease subunit
MISVESKTFEFGVMRMVGLPKAGIVHMVILQSFMFVLPAVLAGFILSMPTLGALQGIIFSQESFPERNYLPNFYAVLQALFIGFVIPILSSLVPIRTALSKNLKASLDPQRFQT